MNTTLETTFPIQLPAIIKPRDPKVAGLLSKSCPGLGHIYAGDIRRGLTFLAAVDLPLALGALFLVAPWGSAVVAIVLWVVALAISIFSITDAKKTVLRTRPDYRMKDYNHWSVYTVIAVVPTMAAAIAVALAIITTVSHSVVAASPLPQIDIQTGDRFVEWKTAYRNNKPTPGEYIVYRGPLGSGMLYMGQIVALPGDSVNTSQGKTFIPEGSLGLQRTDSTQGQLIVSEMAVTGKLLYRYWPLQRWGSMGTSSQAPVSIDR